jgi:chlorite dismutase
VAPDFIQEYKVPDLRERSVGPKGGEPQILDRRLYMQLQVFTDCEKPDAAAAALKGSGFEAALYLDLNDPRGIGVVAMAEDSTFFTGPWRAFLLSSPFADYVHRPGLTMFGRSYSTGRDPDLEFALLKKPRQAALNPAWGWAVWYPLRRKAEFNVLPPEEQVRILREHSLIGMAFGAADLAHDIRLNCFGLDRDDNEFIIGLVGRDLHPLSAIVQEMRKTVQTSQYIRSLGPFFVGRVLWQSPMR